MLDRHHYDSLVAHTDHTGRHIEPSRLRIARMRICAYVVALTAPAMPLATLADAASGDPQAAAITRPQVRVPTRPAALFEGAPARQHTEIHYEPDTQTVTIKMLVQDAQGYFVPNIRRENFVVFEDGQRQHNASVEIERSPVTIAVLLEYGGRYRGLTTALARELYPAVTQFLDEIGREDRVSFLRYGDHLEKLADFSEGHETLQRSLLSLAEPAPVSEANFYDALIETIPRLEKQSGRKAVLIFSSGLDTFSRHGFEDTLEAARQADIPIYVISLAPMLERELGSQRSTSIYAAYDWHRLATQLQQIARASGARVYAPESSYDLAPIFDDLMENLRTRYVITYRSTAAGSSAKERTVRIELQDSRNGSPLKIIDADGHAVQTRISFENRYVADESAAQEENAPRATDAAETNVAVPGTDSSSRSQ